MKTVKHKAWNAKREKKGRGDFCDSSFYIEVVLKLQRENHLADFVVNIGFPRAHFRKIWLSKDSTGQNCILNRHLKWFWGAWTLGHTFQESYGKNYQERVCWGDLHLQYHDVSFPYLFSGLESVVGKIKRKFTKTAHFHFCLNSSREFFQAWKRFVWGAFEGP